MILIMTAYLIMTLVLAVTGGLNAGIMVAVYTLTTVLLFTVSGVRLRQVSGRERQAAKGPRDRDMLISGWILSLIFIALAQWLSSGFSVGFFGERFDGWVWGWLGFAVAFLLGNRFS